MRAGQLKQRIEIQAATTARDAFGEPIKTWATTAKRWARVEPLTGGERADAIRIVAEVSHKVTMRHEAGLLSATKRILFGDRVFNIETVMNSEERGAEMVALCKER